METLLALCIGALFAAGFYSLVRRNLVRVVAGVALLSHAFNLLLFTSGRLLRLPPPIIPEGAEAPPGPVADPLPEALVLTALVINLGQLAFVLVLAALAGPAFAVTLRAAEELLDRERYVEAVLGGRARGSSPSRSRWSARGPLRACRSCSRSRMER